MHDEKSDTDEVAHCAERDVARYFEGVELSQKC